MGIADRLDHVSIAVHQISSLAPFIQEVLGAQYLMGADETAQGFRWIQFQFPQGGVIELIEPLGEGFLAKFLRERGEGLHHVTLRVTDIEAKAKDLRDLGLDPFKPDFSDPTWKEMFIHPGQSHGVLIQLAESDLPYDEEVRFYQQLDLSLLLG